MFHPASLGGIRGLSDLRSRQANPTERIWRGTFLFRAEDEDTIERLADGQEQVWYEALFDGERKRLHVRITGVSLHGLAFFEGFGEPQDASVQSALGPAASLGVPR